MVVFRPGGQTPVKAVSASDTQQVSAAAIAVTVTDSDGSVLLPGVTVTAANAKTKGRWIITDDKGTGFLRHLEPGNWALTFEKEGFATHARDLHVRDGESNSTNVSLTTAGVEVQGSLPEGDTQEAKRKKLMKYLGGEVYPAELKNNVSETSGTQQGSGAAIAVAVTESDGSVVLPGVTVTATNARTGKKQMDHYRR